MDALRVITHSARIPRLLLGAVIAVGLGMGLWLALVPVTPLANIVLAAPNDTISGLAATNDSPKVVSDTVTFSASVSAGTDITYTWDFGDGSNSTGISTTHAYTAAGTFTATVVASNTTDIVTETTSVVILEPIYGLTASNDSPKAINAPISFTASVTSGTGISYTWDFGDGNNSTGITTTHAYTAAGVYSATVLAQTAAQTATATTTVTVVATTTPELPIEGLTATNNGPKEVNDPVNFTATITSGVGISYTWDFGDGGSGSGITTTHSYTLSGSYTATVVVSNTTNTVTATTQVEIADAIVEVRDNVYVPVTATIPAGGRVIWLYKGSNPHSVTANDGSFNQPSAPAWESFSHEFPSAAAANERTFDYYCTVHGTPTTGMRGTIVAEVSLKLNLPMIGKNLIAQ